MSAKQKKELARIIAALAAFLVLLITDSDVPETAYHYGYRDALISQEDYHHVIACVWNSGFTCSEEIQYRVEEYQCDYRKQYTHDYVKRNNVSQNVLCR